MLMEDKIIEENIISQEHISEIYNLFVNLCDSDSFGLTPLDFINIFSNITKKKNINVDNDIWNQIFFQIDYDKNGKITFQDLLTWVYYNLKIIFGEVGEKFSFNKINHLTTLNEKYNFHSIISTIFFNKFGNLLNPFVIVETAKKIQPLYSEINLAINKTGALRYINDGETKNLMFRQTLEKLCNLSYINEISHMINSNSELIFGLAISFNRELKSFDFVTNHFELIIYIPEILNSIRNLANSGLFDKLIFCINLDFNLLNPKFICSVLKIFRKIIGVSLLLLDLHLFCKANELTYTKSFENEILSLKDFIEAVLIAKIISRLNYILEIDDSKISTAAHTLVLVISNINMLQMSVLITETNFFNRILMKMDSMLNSNQLGVFYLLDSFKNELRKLLFYCLYITKCICLMNSNNNCINTYYSTLGNVLNKMVVVAENLNPIFSISDQIFHYYYFILIGFLTKKMNFNDKNFIVRGQEAVSKNIPFLLRPYCFYIKNYLLNSNKKDTLTVLTDAKTIEFLNAIVETNKSEELIISEYLEILELIVKEHIMELFTSTLLRELILILQKFLRYYNQPIVKKSISLLKSLSCCKEPLVDSLILDTDIIGLTSKAVLNFKNKDNFFIDMYGSVKEYFDTILVGDVITFLVNIIESELVKIHSKYLKSFNIENLSNIIKLYHSIYSLWTEQYFNDDEGRTADSSIFEKYKDIANMDILRVIIDFTKTCFSVYECHYNKLYLDDRENLKYILTFLECNIKDLEDKYLMMPRDNENSELVLPDHIFEELVVSAQSSIESEKNLWTTFKFSGDRVVYGLVTSTIEKHYKSSLNFYYVDDTSKSSYSIKDENDFYEILDKIIQDIRNFKKTSMAMRLFVMPANDKQAKYIIICLCCNRRYGIDERDASNIPKEKLLCEECRSKYLSQLVTNCLTTRGSPLKNIFTSSMFDV